MATEKNFKNVSKKVLNNVWSAICWLGRGLESLGKIVVICLGYFIYGIIAFLVFNPLVMFFWAFIAPKSAASNLYGLAESSFWGEVLLVLNSPVIAILPWYAKKAFLWKSGLIGCSIKKQLRFFREADDEGKAKIVEKPWLDNEAKDILWRDPNNHQVLVKTMLNLSDAQFEGLLDRGEFEILKAYMSKYTLSDNKIFSLIKLASRGFNSGSFSTSPAGNYWNLLKSVIRRNGLSAQIVRKIYSLCPNLKDAVSNELAIFAQKQIVIDTQSYNNCSDGWQKFCKKAEEIFEDAQILMNIWQYDAFHNAGKTLSEKAIAYFLSKGDLAMAERIFKYEKKNGILNDEIEALVAANPRLTKLLLAVA